MVRYTRSQAQPRARAHPPSQFGQGMAEYIIIVALVAVAGISVWSAVGSTVHFQASAIATELAGDDGSGARDSASGQAGQASTAAAPNTLGDYVGQN